MCILKFLIIKDFKMLRATTATLIAIRKNHLMFKILVPVTIIASSVACMANAETKINVS